MVLYVILAIIVIILIIVGILFYMRSNKSQIIEKAETRKVKVEQLPYDESLSQLSELTLTGETKTTYNSLKQNALDSKNQYLLPVEEKIHDAEGLLDKFKFSQAQTEIDEAHELMDKYEENYNELTSKVENILNLGIVLVILFVLL